MMPDSSVSVSKTNPASAPDVHHPAGDARHWLSILNGIEQTIIVTDTAGVIEYLNPAAAKMLDIAPADAAGMPFSSVCSLFDETGAAIPDGITEAVKSGAPVHRGDNIHFVNAHKDGFEVEITCTPVKDPGGAVLRVIVLVRDVTEMRRHTRKIAYLASHDALTGLCNRAEFERRLNETIDLARTRGTQHSMLYFDLDKFKIVNDTAGHTAGDQLLRNLANLVVMALRNGDTLARLGGDEFGVLLGNCPLEPAQRIARKICDSVKEFRFSWEGKTFPVGVSVGVVSIGEGSDSASLLSAADAAVYKVKVRGGNDFEVASGRDAETAKQALELDWVSRINDALARRTLFFELQPVVPCAPATDRRPLYQEALVRMHADGNRTAYPAEFLPIAERYKLIQKIDRFAVEWVCKSLAGRSSAGVSRISINLSAASVIDKEFAGFTEGQLRQWNTGREQLVIEISEPTAINNLMATVELIRRLKPLGCAFALDDFGSGLLGLNYLKNLPIDYIKIDAGIIGAIERSEVHAAIVESINRVAHLMNMKTIAECVENESTLVKVIELGVDFVQGYAIQKPVPLI